MLEKIRKWYVGKCVPHEKEVGSGLFVLGGDYERHWTARAARVVVEFYLREWKWVIATTIALVVVALRAVH